MHQRREVILLALGLLSQISLFWFVAAWQEENSARIRAKKTNKVDSGGGEKRADTHVHAYFAQYVQHLIEQEHVHEQCT